MQKSLAVKLPVDVRALGIGNPPTNETDDIAILEIGHMSISEDEYSVLLELNGTVKYDWAGGGTKGSAAAVLVYC